MTEDRGQKKEDRGQRIEDRGQKKGDRGQRTEDRRKGTEDRGQRTEGSATTRVTQLPAPYLPNCRLCKSQPPATGIMLHSSLLIILYPSLLSTLFYYHVT